MLAHAVGLRADRYDDYIERYAPLATEQQERYGIPASITLAQGLLESAAGRSTLATRGNNHFGIKCHNTWTGDTLLRDDDAVGECFRAYADVRDSYEDHSRFLTKKRYSRLFELEPDDYAGWARGLKECGYATDPHYADRLITIIDRYALYAYDGDGDAMAEANARFILEQLQNSHAVRRSRGLHYVIATPGDTYTKIAEEFHLDAEKLMAYNEVEHDGEIRAWEEVYLQEKHDDAPEGLKKVTIGEEETIRTIAQRYGMKISTLERLNPKPGRKLKLR